MARVVAFGPLAVLLLAGCARKEPGPDPLAQGVPAMQVTSSAFSEGGTIPRQYTADGKDISPPLRWSGAPPTTRSFALICDDPDAPRAEPWVHWVLFNLPAATQELPEGVPADATVLGGAQQGKNDFGKLGYGGPDPPRGKPHRYYFKLYALDPVLELAADASKQQLEQAMRGHVVAAGQLLGTYGR